MVLVLSAGMGQAANCFDLIPYRLRYRRALLQHVTYQDDCCGIFRCVGHAVQRGAALGAAQQQGSPAIGQQEAIHLERYKNPGGNSGVVAYEIGNDSITIQFRDGAVYLYNNQRTGSVNIERLKSLAISGQGLNGFISSAVKKGYAAKLR